MGQISKKKSDRSADLGIKLAFTSKAVFVNIMAALLRFITLYATDGLGLEAAKVGMIFMTSQALAILMNIAAGFLIEHTKTRLGQARPYDLAVVGYGVSILLLFHAPAAGETIRIVYLFVMYTLTVGVFGTLIVCNEAPYLSNAIPDTKKSLSIVSFSSAVSMIFAIAAAVMVPQMISRFGTSADGWFTVALILVAPSTMIGLIKFLTVKELNLSPYEVAFEARYDLFPAEGADINMLMIPNGEYDEESGWIKNCFCLGVLRPDDNGGYVITEFGTGW